MSAIKVNDQSFETEVLNSSEPVLVDFWAPWCGPCRAMSGVVDDVATELNGQAKVVKANVEEASQAAARYGIQSIPAFAVFQNGEVKNQTMGVMPKEKLLGLLTPHLN